MRAVIPPYLITAALAWFITYWTTPTTRRLSRWTGAIDYPGPRRINRRPLPRLGGLAIFLGILASAVLTLPMKPAKVAFAGGQLFLTVPFGGVSAPVVGILLGAAAIVALGVLDDLRPLSGKLKFPLIYGIAAIPVAFGLSAPILTNPFTGTIFGLGLAGQVFTAIWIGSAAIAVNLIDGVDGLAAGISAIVGATFFTAALPRQDLPILVLSAAVVGSAVAFLRYNFNPARVIMGDGGAMLLGFLLGAVSVLGLFKTITAVSLAVPLLALGVPIFDTAFAILRRVRRGLPVFHPDRGHLHHRLLDRGLSQRQTVFLLYGATSLLGVAALWLSGSVDRVVAMGLFIVLAGALVVSAHRMGLILMRPSRDV
jgi:UDP-GlcNAc:undecaprenyl-phosphate GlcNAc-1-phosphate transferase